MSKALDKLDATINESVKNGTATKNMTREQLMDYLFSTRSALSAHLSFYEGLTLDQKNKMRESLLTARNNPNSKKNLTVVVENQMIANLTGIAKLRQEKEWCGAIIETAQSLHSILEEVAMNVDKLFVDKTFNLYNTKISHVAIFGILDSAELFSNFMENLITAQMADMKPDMLLIAPYAKKFLEDHVVEVAGICNRMINGKLGKTFAAGVIRYKQSGNDVTVLTSDNKNGSKFAKLGNDVTENDVSSGCRGLHIFRIIGDFIVDFFDKRARKMRALREQHKARVEFLQMELEGEDPNSPRYKKIVTVIKNYNDLINRLNQQLDKYYNED